jgi:hypothetical protein
LWLLQGYALAGGSPSPQAFMSSLFHGQLPPPFFLSCCNVAPSSRRQCKQGMNCGLKSEDGINETSRCGRSVSKLVQSVAPHFLSLQSCNLRRCMYLVDPAIEAIGAHWHDLRTLDLSSGTRLTDASLYDLARGCTLLEKLDLSGCVGITEAGLVVLAECCKNLRHLNLCGCIIAGSDTALVVRFQPDPSLLARKFHTMCAWGKANCIAIS